MNVRRFLLGSSSLWSVVPRAPETGDGSQQQQQQTQQQQTTQQQTQQQTA